MHGYGIIKGISGVEIGCHFVKGDLVKSEFRNYPDEVLYNKSE
jgi:hypothetical protein